MESNKWEYRENFHSTGCGDYDGHYEITDGSIFICTTDDPDDITEKENSLQQIARLLNESGCKFYSNNALEIKQHIEILELGYRIYELQAKCDRYEELLQAVHQKAKEGIFPHLPVETMGAQKCIEIDTMLNEALSAGEGEKEGDARKAIDPVLLVKYIREHYKPHKGEWKDFFGIATLSDEGIVNMFNQKEDQNDTRNPG